MFRPTSLVPEVLWVLVLAALVGCSRAERVSGEPTSSAAPSASPGERAGGSSAPAPLPAGTPGGTPSGPIVLGRADTPDAPLRRVNGDELVTYMKTTGNRATLVNAWASWCGPCRREMPMLVGLMQNLSAQGVEVLFVSVDEPESEQAALAFLNEQGGKPPVYVADRPLSAFKQALNPRWRGMLPATFLFDAEGKLRYFWGGPVYENELLPIIDGFLAGKHIDGEATFGLAPGQDSRQ